MEVTGALIATILITATGAIVAAPVLFQGFRRRGSGVKYERNFLIQRAPQLMSVANIAVITLCFIAQLNVFAGLQPFRPFLTQNHLLPGLVATIISWLGVMVLVSGMIFMIGGWYSLGEAFSTDAELLDGQTVKRDGLLKFVMHPAYSGIIQCLIGASLAAVSALAFLFAVICVAPLWLARAKYEEKLLIDTFGDSYKEYARDLGWRRLIPNFFPIGV